VFISFLRVISKYVLLCSNGQLKCANRKFAKEIKYRVRLSPLVLIKHLVTLIVHPSKRTFNIKN